MMRFGSHLWILLEGSWRSRARISDLPILAEEEKRPMVMKVGRQSV
jgi:hypothetical protein